MTLQAEKDIKEGSIKMHGYKKIEYVTLSKNIIADNKEK